MQTTVYIGAVAISPPLALAPMAGVTNLPFRLLCRRAGAGLVCSEMVSAVALCHDSRRTLAMLASDPRERPLSLQIFGGDPETMARAAAIICERAQPDLLDINMGCTVPKVTKGGAGACLLGDPGRAEAIVRAVTKASSVPVTVKLRARWRAGYPDAVELGQRFVDAGAAALVIHPRSAQGKFAAPLEWDLAARLVQAVPVPVWANGQVNSLEGARQVLAETGAVGLMVGRAALGNPWIFAQLAVLWGGPATVPPTREDRLRMALEHGGMLAGLMGEQRAARQMRKHVAWYARHFRDAALLRVAAGQAHTWSALAETLRAAMLAPPGSGLPGVE